MSDGPETTIADRCRDFPDDDGTLKTRTMFVIDPPMDRYAFERVCRACTDPEHVPRLVHALCWRPDMFMSSMAPTAVGIEYLRGVRFRVSLGDVKVESEPDPISDADFGSDWWAVADRRHAALEILAQSSPEDRALVREWFAEAWRRGHGDQCLLDRIAAVHFLTPTACMTATMLATMKDHPDNFALHESLMRVFLSGQGPCDMARGAHWSDFMVFGNPFGYGHPELSPDHAQEYKTVEQLWFDIIEEDAGPWADVLTRYWDADLRARKPSVATCKAIGSFVDFAANILCGAGAQGARALATPFLEACVHRARMKLALRTTAILETMIPVMVLGRIRATTSVVAGPLMDVLSAAALKKDEGEYTVALWRELLEVESVDTVWCGHAVRELLLVMPLRCAPFMDKVLRESAEALSADTLKVLDSRMAEYGRTCSESDGCETRAASRRRTA